MFGEFTLVIVVLLLITNNVVIATDCNLPDSHVLRIELLSVESWGGGGLVITTRGGPYYTCQVQGTTNGTYQELSVIMEYSQFDDYFIQILDKVGQFELICHYSPDGWSMRYNSLTVLSQGHGVTYDGSIGLRTDCSSCINTTSNDNNCVACNHACNSGLMRCTGSGSDDCCVAFEEDGVCKPDLNCDTNNFVANAQNNFTCAPIECSGLSCSDGYTLNSSTCNCTLTDICVADNPCNNNGLCTLGSSPDTFTCDCTGTGFMGLNCSDIQMTGVISGVSGDGCNRNGFSHSVEGDLCVLMGEQVTISCETYQPYTISGPKGIIAINDDLIITSYTADYEGSYYCWTNEENMGEIKVISNYVTLIPINGARTVTSIRHSSTIISFTTMAMAYPPVLAFFDWYFIPKSSSDAQRELEIRTDSKYTISSDGLTLTIKNTLSTDIGDYRIVAINEDDHYSGEGVITLNGVYDGCHSDITLIPSHSGNSNLTIILSWNEANIGETVTVGCPCGNLNVGKDGRLTATRYCGGDFTNGGKWSNAIIDQCNFTDLSRQICQLLDLQVYQRVNLLDQFTSTPSRLQTTEVFLSVFVLATATDDIKGNLTLSESFMNVADNILQVDEDTLKDSQQTFNTSAKILEAIESVADSIPLPVNSSVPVVIARSQFAVSAQAVDSNTLGEIFSVELANGSNFTSDSLNFMKVSNSSTASISIPNNVFKSFSISTQLRLTNAVYLQESAFLRRGDYDLEVGSIIISASLHGNNTNGTIFDPPIVLKFKKTKSITTSRDAVCSFWDPSLDSGYGNWSGIGCHANMTISEEEVVCLCNHLTSFSILLDVSPSYEFVQTPTAQALNTFTYIGIIVSLFCLILLCVSYLYSQKLRLSEHGQLLLNLCFALIGLYITFIFALYSTPVTWLCAFVSAMLQYFFLATFIAMAAEAINIYLKLVVVLGSKISHYVLKVVIINWSVPFFIVLFCFAPKYQNYVSDHFCRVFNAPYYIGVVVPFILLYIFNCIVFTLVFISLLRKSYQSKHDEGATKSTDKDSNVSFVRRQLVIIFTLSVLFGIGWGIGLLATQDAHSNTAVRDVLSALFILITAFHGVFIFIMNGIRSIDVRSVWKRWFGLVTRTDFEEFSLSLQAGTFKRRSNLTSTTNNPSYSFARQTSREPGTLKKGSSSIDNDHDSGTLKYHITKKGQQSAEPINENAEEKRIARKEKEIAEMMREEAAYENTEINKKE